MGSAKSKTAPASETVARVDHNIVNNGDARDTDTHMVLTIITLAIMIFVCVVLAAKYAIAKCTKRLVAAIKEEAVASIPA